WVLLYLLNSTWHPCILFFIFSDIFFFFFFFQAEDGIRDRNVTGVQTCALPILRKVEPFDKRLKERAKQEPFPLPETYAGKVRNRSEERRVGKECRSRWSPHH